MDNNHHRQRSLSAPTDQFIHRKKSVSIGSIVDDHWKLEEVLGSGSFGQTFSASDIRNDSSEKIALKVSTIGKETVLVRELKILRELQDCDRVVRLIGQGRAGDTAYVALELLGENLNSLRKKYGTGEKPSFSLATAIRLGIQMVQCLEQVHQCGYVHRDVKPVGSYIVCTVSLY